MTFVWEVAASRMRFFFLAVFLALLLLTGVAWVIRPAPAPPGKVPLVWASDDNPTRREQIALFNQLHPHYWLQLDPLIPNTEKITVQAIGGVGPDLFDCYSGSQLAGYVRSGVAWDLTDRLKSFHIDPQRDLWRATDANILRDGRIYAFPTNAAVNAIWYHREIFEAEGLKPPRNPWKWEEFIPLAQRLNKRDSNGKMSRFGFVFDWDNNWYQFVLQWGGRLYSDDGTQVLIDRPEAIAGFQFMRDLVYRYHVSPTPTEEAAMATQGGWGSGSISWFGGRRGAMALGGRWWLNLLRGYQGLRLGAMECPVHDRRVFLGYGRATVINSKSPRREEALSFLAYEASKPYNDLINHQADAVSPVRRYCYLPQFLHDPAYPQEDYNAVWRDVMQYGVPMLESPFVNGQAVERLLKKQRDLVQNGQKSAAEAFSTAAQQVRALMRETLSRDPVLRERYLKLTGGRLP